MSSGVPSLAGFLAEIQSEGLGDEAVVVGRAVSHRHPADSLLQDGRFASFPGDVIGGGGVFEIAHQPLAECAVAGKPPVGVLLAVADDPDPVVFESIDGLLELGPVFDAGPDLESAVGDQHFGEQLDEIEVVT